jgi:hypothetical protein
MSRSISSYLLLFLTLVIAGSCFAQTTVVRGTVSDAETGEPIPFANVYFIDTKSGTTTNIDGKYYLETYYTSDSLRASSLGYIPETKRAYTDKDQTLNFVLNTSSIMLEAAIIRPTEEENPAHPIIRNILKNKDINNREKLEAYEYELYNKVEFDLNNFSEEFTQRRIMRPFQFIFDGIDSTEEKVYLPLFMTESMSDFYYRKTPKIAKEHITATKVSGIENKSVSQFLGDMYQNVNIYDNNIVMFNKSFVSPISNSGFTFYKYYLTDSTYIDSKWCYKILFLPKRKQELTFTGEFWVNDTTYAIKKINASIADDANINFIRSLDVQQEFNEVEKEVWMLTKDHLVIDFNVSGKTMGFYGRKTTSYRDFVINKPREPNFYTGISDIIVDDDAGEKTDEFWTEARHEELSKNEEAIYHMVDSLFTVPQFRTVLDVITLFVSGYKTVGWWEFGPYYTLYSYNPIEGNRFRLGGRTSNEFSKRLELNGHVAYGLTDQRFKYAGGMRYMLSKQPRMLLQLNYKRDLEQLGQSDDAFLQDNVLSSLFRRNPANKLTDVTEYKVSLEREWFYGFSNRISAENRLLRPLGKLVYERFDDSNTIQNVKSITTTEFTLYTRFAYKEKFLAGEIDRISLGTTWPTLDLTLTMGVKGVMGADYDYQKASFRVKDKIRMGAFGYAYIWADVSKVWGNLPYPLLILHQGNETFFYDETAFNTMNFFEFVSDQSVSGSITWHLDGFFLNKIPLFRKLKWREVVSAKGVIGSFSDANENALLLPENTHTLREPFGEAAFGIENIFKFLRLDMLYRLSYLDHPDIFKLGVRAKIDITF